MKPRCTVRARAAQQLVANERLRLANQESDVLDQERTIRRINRQQCKFAMEKERKRRVDSIQQDDADTVALERKERQFNILDVQSLQAGTQRRRVCSQAQNNLQNRLREQCYRRENVSKAVAQQELERLRRMQERAVQNMRNTHQEREQQLHNQHAVKCLTQQEQARRVAEIAACNEEAQQQRQQNRRMVVQQMEAERVRRMQEFDDTHRQPLDQALRVQQVVAEAEKERQARVVDYMAGAAAPTRRDRQNAVWARHEKDKEQRRLVTEQVQANLHNTRCEQAQRQENITHAIEAAHQEQERRLQEEQDVKTQEGKRRKHNQRLCAELVERERKEQMTTLHQHLLQRDCQQMGFVNVVDQAANTTTATA